MLHEGRLKSIKAVSIKSDNINAVKYHTLNFYTSVLNVLTVHIFDYNVKQKKINVEVCIHRQGPHRWCTIVLF